MISVKALQASACLLAAIVTTPLSAEVVSSGDVKLPLIRDFTGNGLDVVTGATSRNPNDQDADIIIFELSDEWRFANLDRFEGGGIVVQQEGSLNAQLLEPGDIVGPDQPLREGGGIRTLGKFDDVPNAYIGICFINESTNTLHYGYVRVFLPSQGDGVITEYAYESEPRTPITIPGACAVDFAEPFGELDFFDIQEFLARLAVNDPSADLNNDATWDFFDLSNFLTLFQQGCP